jgi:hypothetical protein
MQRLAIIIAVAGAAAIPIAVNAASGAAAGSSDRTVTVKEDLRHQSVFAFIDPSHGSTDPSVNYPGDYIVEKAPLRNKAGKRIGTLEGVLTFITGSKNLTSDLMNRRVWNLHNGSLFIEGLDGPHVRGGDVVTGGTGAYAGARGVITSKGQFDTAHLLP